MTKYINFIVKLCNNSQLIKLKSGIKNGTEVTLNPSSNVTCYSNDETNFLITDRQVQRFRKCFVNNSSANIKLSTNQLFIIE